MKKLYVGNLPWGVTDKDLADLFSDIGEVESANVAIDRESGRSKGFGFVEMTSDDDAQKAIEQLNESDVSGRTIKVNFKRENPNRQGGYRPRNNHY